MQLQQPVTQEKLNYRQNLPEWFRQLPKIRFPAPNEEFQLVDRAQLDALIGDMDNEARQRLYTDLDVLNLELLPLFRERDYLAKYHQNRYRLYQIIYMLLAAAATLVGSLLALALNTSPQLVSFLSFVETLIALLTYLIVNLSGREPALPAWLDNRRRAETLRREYFRYLMNLAPYRSIKGFERRMVLARRAADMNRGVYPETEQSEQRA
ncbi:MAG: DUF4231 domain-containing protein [Anaerolineae bacterium]|jgi:hypothetical protein|nr:DUF4231 domain-containing protein [Anaerolineae bacterium]